jgi:ubiquinol-cytochrome c reductase iron-sulfur subunit
VRRFLQKRIRRRMEGGDRRPKRRRLTLAAAIGAFLAALGLRRAWRATGKALREREEYPRDQDRAAAVIGFWFVFSMACGGGLLALYALGGQTQIEGALLGGSLGGIGTGLFLWGKYLFPKEVVTEDREPLPSDIASRSEASDLVAGAERDVTRRRFLFRLLGGAGGAFLVAMVFPLRSLGPSPGSSLLRTRWRAGSRVVDEQGAPVRADDLPPNGVITVFPEHYLDVEDSQAILVKIPLDLTSSLAASDLAPEGNICFSKICTHAGCPVGLYVASLHQLQCPCHRSAFDVLNGGRVLFGPAARPLPQLPLEVDADGFLRARGDFPEPVGPAWWSMPTEQKGQG